MVAEAFAIAPLEVLPVTRDLDGSCGANRESNVLRQIGADTDVAAVLAWLANLTIRRAAFDAYRKEAERLLLWCVLQHGKALSSMTQQD